MFSGGFDCDVPTIAACMSGVVSEHSQFARPCPLSKLEGEAEASGASIHHSPLC